MRRGYVVIKDATGNEYTINQDRIYHLVRVKDCEEELRVLGFGVNIKLRFTSKAEADDAYQRLVAD